MQTRGVSIREQAAAWHTGGKILLLALVAALPLILFGGFAVHEINQERQARQRQLLSVAHAFAEHADAAFSAIDVALGQIELALAGRSVASARSDLLLHQRLQDILRRLPALESLFVVDEAGIVAASSRAFPMPPYDVRHRDYFQAADQGEAGLFFSVPFRGEFARSVAFTVTRRITREGAFAGIVGATVFPDYFQTLYRAAAPAEGRAAGAALLLRRDGVPLVRAAPRGEGTGAPVRLRSEELAAGAGLLSGADRVEPGTDIAAFRVLPTTALVFVYAAREGDLLGPLHRRLGVMFLFSLALGAALAAGAGWLLFPPPRRAVSAGAVPSTSEEGYYARAADGILDLSRSALALLRRDLPPAPPRAPLQIPSAEALDGALQGVALAQKLIAAGGRARSADARIVDVRRAVIAVRGLTVGALWPPLTIDAKGLENLPDIFVHPAAFELALAELVLAGKDACPAGTPLSLKVTAGPMADAAGHETASGSFVAIRLTCAPPAEMDDRLNLAGTRLRHVARFAKENGGSLVHDRTQATLYLPTAIIARPISPRTD